MSPGGSRLAWFHCFAGIAGDMAFASLLDAGADLAEVRALLARLPLPGWHLEVESVRRSGLAASRVLVSVHETGVSRDYTALTALLAEAKLPQRVEERSAAVFEALATAEARLHRTPLQRVHLHEVGGHDAVVDVVGTVAALEVLGVDEIAASPVALGTGTITCAHGVLPNPAPATVELLTGAPVYSRPVDVELTTPTGAALLRGLGASFGPLPGLLIEGSGFGAGSGELPDLPNCTQVVVGTRPETGAGPGQPLSVLETNLDDVTGEQLGHAVDRLLDAGARDAWVTPIVMKKGRPAHTLHVLCDPSEEGRLRGLVADLTGTLGIRRASVGRWAAERHEVVVEVDGLAVRVKVGPVRAKPEFDDVARVAERTGRAPAEVAEAALAAWRRLSIPDGGPGAGAG